MSSYIIELGLDAGASPRPDGTYPSLVSLVNEQNPPTPAWLAGFENNDTLMIRVFDYGSVLHDAAIQLLGVYFRFLRTGDQTCLSSYVSPNFICADHHRLKPSPESQVLPPATGWTIVKGSDVEVSFTINVPPNSKETAVMRLTAFVLVGSELRQYGHDPEIFIGAGS